jgi:hypothetical protein
MTKPDFDDPGIPFERHGEMGTLFSPKVQFNLAEMTFSAEVETACLELNRESLERDEFLAVINKISEEKGYSLAMCARIIAFYDELALRRASLHDRQ